MYRARAKTWGLNMAVLESRLDTRSDQYLKNRADMLAKLAELDALYEEAAKGGGEEGRGDASAAVLVDLGGTSTTRRTSQVTM